MSKHALIFDIQALSSMVIQNELIEMDYTSFDWSPNAAEAVHLAKVRCPDLIVAGEMCGVEEAVLAVEEICAQKPIPLLFITHGGYETKPPLPSAVVIETAFHPREFRQAVEAACEIVEHPNVTIWQKTG